MQALVKISNLNNLKSRQLMKRKENHFLKTVLLNSLMMSKQSQSMVL